MFEQSFGNPPLETPGGRPILPPVANIASPALPGITPGWGATGSLRSGPLSPAMLSGPSGQDYFGDFSGRGFPTPNESSLRTGLTPGGTGSMFPAASPNTQAIFTLQSGIATPNTAEFHNSAIRMAAQNKFPPTSVPTSQPDTVAANMNQPNNYHQPQQTLPQRGQNDPYHQPDVNGAAADLLSFSQQNGPNRTVPAPFTMPQHPQQNNMGHMPVQPVAQENGRRNTKTSIHSMPGSADDGEFSDGGQSNQKQNPRARGRRAAAGVKQTGNKRKADEAPKGGNKKTKTNMAGTPSLDGMEDESEEDASPTGENGKKMTDEEKRKNFLERNRLAYSPTWPFFIVLVYVLKLTCMQGRCTQMPATQEAMAGQSAKQG